MDSTYNHTSHEPEMQKLWENSGGYQPRSDFDQDKNTPYPHGVSTGKNFSIILPPPNANDPLHVGHAMYAVEDVLIRYHRMLGDDTLWLPGTDHAGIETQYVFEKKLQQQGKSRFQFDRQSLYQQIWDYVQTNSQTATDQLKRLGFSLDWTRFVFTLDEKVVQQVYDAFYKLHKDGLIYRDFQLVNYCTKCGTSYSDLEVVYVEKNDPLYYIKYGPFEVATVRPETKFGDVALAVHPDDKRYSKYIGQTVKVQDVLGEIELPVLSDDFVDPEFGTGVVKITPAHDLNDFMVGKKHNLPTKPVIDTRGKMTADTQQFAGLSVAEARTKTVEALTELGLITKVDNKYTHSVGTCYRCGRIIEPLPLPQFFLRVKDKKNNLVKKIVQVLDQKQTKILGPGREKTLRHWLDNLVDWNISRQIVWGMRIPVWYQAENYEHKITLAFLDQNGQYQAGLLSELLKTYDRDVVVKGLQSLSAASDVPYVLGQTKPTDNKFYLPETDTFDTWFSSGQWPIVTLHATQPGDFDRFYPNSVMETAYDILPIWVMRMMLLGIYLTGQTPFQTVYLHGLIRDSKGVKMSKSKGNVVNPLSVVDQFGADALRLALVIRSSPGQDKSVGEGDFKAARNFTNKIWNAARYVADKTAGDQTGDKAGDQVADEKLNQVIKDITRYLDQFKLGLAADTLYDEFWHWYCDQAIEQHKKGELSHRFMRQALVSFIKMLHPFVPFVTEAIWQNLQSTGLIDHHLLMTSPWPNTNQLNSNRSNTK